MISSLMYVSWDVDPVMLSLGSLEVRYYGLCWAIALAIGWYIYGDIMKREGYGEKVFDSLFWCGTIGIILGARLGHCLFYDTSYYLSHPIELLNFRQGGMASHGGVIGAMIGMWIFSRRNKVSLLWTLDRLGLASALGGAVVRFGNLLNSEIYGLPTSLPWGFVFLRNGETEPMHPTQIYEALCYTILFFILYHIYYRTKIAFRRPGVMFGVTMLGFFATRFFIEFIKNPQMGFEDNMSLLMGQWLSIPFVIAGVYYIVRAYRGGADGGASK